MRIDVWARWVRRLRQAASLQKMVNILLLQASPLTQGPKPRKSRSVAYGGHNAIETPATHPQSARIPAQSVKIPSSPANPRCLSCRLSEWRHQKSALSPPIRRKLFENRHRSASASRGIARSGSLGRASPASLGSIPHGPPPLSRRPRYDKLPIPSLFWSHRRFETHHRCESAIQSHNYYNYNNFQ